MLSVREREQMVKCITPVAKTLNVLLRSSK